MSESLPPSETPHFHDHAASHVQRGPLFVVVVVSVVIHLIIGIICGIVIVVGKFVEPPKVEFEEPPTVVEQPQEIKQEVKKRTRAAARVAPKRLITSKAPSPLVIPMPEIRTNVQGKIGGTGTSAIGTLDGEIGGEGLGSFFGSTKGLSSDLRGTYYDLKLTPDKKQSRIKDQGDFARFVDRWVAGSWDRRQLAEFFQAPTQLYATHIWIPKAAAQAAPNAFGVGDICKDNRWIAVYEGSMEASESGQYRLWGVGDDYMVVRVDGRVVLDASYKYLHPGKRTRHSFNEEYLFGAKIGGDGKVKDKDGRDAKDWQLRSYTMWDGDWFSLTQGRAVKIEIFLAEGQGGHMCFALQVEKKGVTYGKYKDGRPILPVFKVRELDEGSVKRINEDKTPNTPRTLDGPVFRAVRG